MSEAMEDVISPGARCRGQWHRGT